MTLQTATSAESNPIDCVCAEWSMSGDFASLVTLLGLWVAVLALVVAIGGLAATAIGPAMGVGQALKVGRRVSLGAVAVAASAGVVVGVTNLIRLLA